MGYCGADVVWESLIREGVDITWGYPGGMAIPLFDSLSKYPQIHNVLVRHEQAAAHAADGYARATGKVGVCISTSGPGATNLVTGIATAMMDSAPMVAITGQVPTSVIGTDAFQEVNITGVTLTITKHNYLVRSAGDLAKTIHEAFYLANTGRPGPILIDVPRDVSVAPTEFEYPERTSLVGYRPIANGNSNQIKRAIELISEAKRPVIISGHGINRARAFNELQRFAELINAPVVSTLLGLSSIPASHPLALGMAGMHGVAWANLAVQNADLLIALGMRMDDRFTGSLRLFAPDAKVVHIDIDPAEIGKRVPVAVPIVGDVKLVLQALLAEVPAASHSDWLAEIAGWRETHPLMIGEGDLPPQEVIRMLNKVTHGEANIVSDVGQHQMWVAQHYDFQKPNHFFTTGGLGTMGYSLPAAMGIQAGRRNEEVWVVCGDGSFQMNLQELATIVQESLPIKIVIVNNGYLGMVRQWQELFHDARYIATPISSPNFVALAAAYGIAGQCVDKLADLEKAFTTARKHNGPFLLDCRVEAGENVYPMVPPGAGNDEFRLDPRQNGEQ